jgi:pre-60S factor REI1
MLGKSHCRFDIANKASEYADFYDLSGSEAESGDEEDVDDTSMPKQGKTESLTVQPDDNSLRLPSGRIISNRSQPQSSTRRHPLKPRSLSEPGRVEGGFTSSQDAQGPASSTSLATQSGKGGLALTRAEKQENKLTKQLATLTANDERSLAHLALPEQRAMLVTQQKQVSLARRVKERYQSRVEGLGNKTLMTHFVKDAADKRTQWK